MDRREFSKLFAVAVLVPSFSGMTAEQKLPAKIKYKGWECLINRIPLKENAIQAYWRKGNKHLALLFDADANLSKIEEHMKLCIDGQIKRETLT